MAVAAERLITAEEFATRPDPGVLEELVRGRIVPMTMPKPRHGYICNKVGRILGEFVESHQLGWVLNNDTGVITERDPDTVRGADVAYYSYARLPRGELPDRYPDVAPELVFEVRSPSDRWPQIFAKAAEYLEAGVLFVVVLDADRRDAHVLGAGGESSVLGAEDVLHLPLILGDFQVTVRRFFE
jgi:Uma2 family endonuclease